MTTSWRIDKTYIKVKGKWLDLYRAIDKSGDTVDFMLPKRRYEAAATAFFKQAIDTTGSLLTKSSWIKTVLTMQVWRTLTSC